MPLSSRVYSAPRTGELVALSNSTGSTTASESSTAKKTFWQWLADVFKGGKEDEATCCEQKHAEAERNCNEQDLDLVLWECIDIRDGSCDKHAQCGTGRVRL